MRVFSNLQEQPLLEVRNLNVEAAGRERPILSDINLTLYPRQILGLIGASGAGKTVLARALVNWIELPLTISSGEIIYKGKDIVKFSRHELRKIRAEVAYVGGNPMGALDPTLPVGRQIVEKLLAVDAHISPEQARKKIIELLEAVRIPSASSRFHEYPSQFSGGMMQRVLIVDALVSNPSFLVADNVTQPLDVTIAAQVMSLMRELTERFNTSVVFISSSLPAACEVADRILVMVQGKVIEEQETKALVRAPAHEYTRELVRQIPRLWSDADARAAAAELSHNDAPFFENDAAGPGGGGNPEPVISIIGATRYYKVRRRGTFAQYDTVRAVNNVIFDIYAGDNFGIVGESGCGKSTLTRLLSRLELPDKGRILCGGKDIAKLRGKELLQFRRQYQLVLQDPYNSLPPRTAVGAMLEEPLRTHGWRNNKEIRGRVLEVMDEVGLARSLYNQLPLGLSAGQRQRVNVARAMVLSPKVLIMDETLSSLDQTEQFKLLQLFERLQAMHGLTYIFISHDLAMVRRACNRIAVMYLGEVVEIAHNNRLFFDPGHPYTKALLSAAPTLEERRYQPGACLLDGEPPSPIDLPTGCSFLSRCPKSFGICFYLNPVIIHRGGQDMAACHLINPLGNYRRPPAD